MKTSVGDYVVLANEKNKMLLVWVTNVTEHQYKGLLDNKDRAIEATAEEISFERSDIFANLGKTPHPGTVYGTLINPWKHSKQIRPWASVSVYCDLNKTEEQLMFDSLKTVGGVLQQRGFLAPKPIDVEVRPPKGKNEGMYYFKHNPEVNDVMIIRTLDLENANMPRIIYHEAGHHIWCHLMTPAIRNSWAEAFINTSIMKEVTKTDLKDYLQNLKESGTCKAFIAKAEDDDEKLIVGEIFKYIQTRHHIDKRMIDSLLETEQFDQIDRVFPTRTTFIGRKDPIISNYGTKKTEEMFCEAFAFYMTDQEINKSIRILLKKTFKELGV